MRGLAGSNSERALDGHGEAHEFGGVGEGHGDEVDEEIHGGKVMGGGDTSGRDLGGTKQTVGKQRKCLSVPSDLASWDRIVARMDGVDALELLLELLHHIATTT